MNSLDNDYLGVARAILLKGIKKKDRTGTGTKSLFGNFINFDMSEGFPLLTTKKVYWKGDYVHETLHIPAEYSRILLKGKLEHYSYKSLEDHWQRLNKYAELRK